MSSQEETTGLDMQQTSQIESTESDIQQVMLSSLLTELRDIKVTILKLDAKIDTSHQELTAKMIDNKEFYELITSQNGKLQSFNKKMKN